MDAREHWRNAGRGVVRRAQGRNWVRAYQGRHLDLEGFG